MNGRGRRDRGGILIWSVFVLAMIGAFMALAIGAGRLYVVRGAIQNAVDGAALAGAAELNGQDTGLAEGREAATALALRHVSDAGLAVAVDRAGDVVFGHWYREGWDTAGNCQVPPGSACFLPFEGSGPASCPPAGCETAANAPVYTNAVQVRSGREAARGNAVPTAFAGSFVGPATLDVNARAVAVGGGPCQARGCFPVAFADCQLLDRETNELLGCDQRIFTLNNDWQDNLGLTNLDYPPGANASVATISRLLDLLRTNPDQLCASSIDNPINVNNGNPLQPLVPDVRQLGLPRDFSAPVVHVDRCPPATYQKCVRATQNDPCVNPRFVGDMPVVGYVTIRVCYVTGSNPVNQWPPAGWPTAECGPAPTQADFPGADPTEWPDPFLKHTIFMRHLCYVEQPGGSAGEAGCGFFGTSSPRSRLVQ